MSKPTPKSSLLQTLLIAAVAYLGISLFFSKNNTPPPKPVALKPAYEEAIKGTDFQALTQATHAYSTSLRGEKKVAEARGVELQGAERMRGLALERKDFNEALAAYNEYHRLAGEDKTDTVGVKAQAELPKIAGQADSIARSGEGPTRLGYSLIHGIVNFFGGDRAPGVSYWLAAVVLAILVRAIIWPLATKQMMGFKRMALLQPMMKELQQKYQGPELNQRMMMLYRKYGINPLAGCFPLVIQMPFFLWVFYSMRLYQFEFHKGTFLWISQAGAAAAPGIVAQNLGERDVPLVLLYGLSMIVSTLVSVNDPNSAKQARIMGISMAVIFTGIMLFTAFPSAFVLYWTVLNILTTIQSVYVSRKPIPPLVEVAEDRQSRGMFGGVMPKDGPTGNGKNGASLGSTKTGAPVVHKPKGGKGKKR